METNAEAVAIPLLDAGREPWVGLRRFTPARIALGRTGGSQRMTTVLDGQAGRAAVSATIAPSGPT